jgi:hypothetical protein
MTWGSEITTVRELLRSIAAGGRLVHSHRWQLDEGNQWYEYRVVSRDGTPLAVRASIAVVALRKGMASVQLEEKTE